MSRLDATVIKKKGKALAAEIVKIVGDSQSFILTPLPDELLLTEDQFISLVPYEDYMQDMTDYVIFTNEMKASKEKLFYTPHNVMEVKVKGQANA